MKRIVLFVMASSVILSSMTACLNSADNNHGLDYDSLDMNFSASIAGGEWSAGDEVGIFATCTRADAENTLMSEVSPACYKAVTSGTSTGLVPASEKDNAVALASDHNFKVYAFAPYDPSTVSVDALPANVPAKVDFGKESAKLYVAKKSVSSVVAPVALSFGSTACSVSLKVPDDIVADVSTVLKTMVVKESKEGSLLQDIAYSAVYNLYTDEIAVVPGSGSKTITIDFGTEGYRMESGYTAVSFLMAPFTVPEGGFSVEFTDMDGNTNTVPFLASNEGKSYAAGDYIEATLSNSSDGIIGCSSPVEWPIGYKDGVGVFNNTVQPLWNPGTFTVPETSEHIWTSSQAQATLKYVSCPDKEGSIKYETNNFSQYNYSAGCVKGLWSGDYFEFDVPVKKFAAGSTVKLTLPTYGRGAPLFWDIDYKDGEAWKTLGKMSFTSPDGQFTKDCSIMFEHGNRDGNFEGITYVVEIPFENEIKSGHILIRLKVAYGEYVTRRSATYSTACEEVTARSVDGTSLFAFVNMSGMTPAISVEW